MSCAVEKSAAVPKWQQSRVTWDTCHGCTVAKERYCFPARNRPPQRKKARKKLPDCFTSTGSPYLDKMWSQIPLLVGSIVCTHSLWQVQRSRVRRTAFKFGHHPFSRCYTETWFPQHWRIRNRNIKSKLWHLSSMGQSPIQVQEERQYPLKSIKPGERNVKLDVNRYSVAYNLLKSTSD